MERNSAVTLRKLFRLWAFLGSLLFFFHFLSCLAGQVPLRFHLKAINGREIFYPQVSPTDGDVLDRGLLTKVVTFSFGSNGGDLVECTDQTGKVLASSRALFPEEDDSADSQLFLLRVDTRELPNGPNRLFFTLYSLPTGDPETRDRLAQLVVVVNLLNHRLEVEKLHPDFVEVRLRAGTNTPDRVDSWRYALFAGATKLPGQKLTLPDPEEPPSSQVVQLPVGGKDGAVRIYPASSWDKTAPWPPRSLSLRLVIDRGFLSELGKQASSGTVYLVGVIYDGNRWELTSVASVPVNLANLHSTGTAGR